MHPLLIVGIVAGAFLLGRRTKKEDVPVLPPAWRDIPEPPTPEHSAMWEMLPYDVQLFPASATQASVEPPPTRDGVVSNDQCTVIAAADGWWDRATEYAQSLSAMGETSASKIYRLVIERFTPRCAQANTTAAAAFRSELAERIGPALGYTQATLQINPARGELCPEQRVSCQPCPTPYSFNPWPIYQSAAYRKSSITNYRAYARNGRARLRGKRLSITR